MLIASAAKTMPTVRTSRRDACVLATVRGVAWSDGGTDVAGIHTIGAFRATDDISTSRAPANATYSAMNTVLHAGACSESVSASVWKTIVAIVPNARRMN